MTNLSDDVGEFSDRASIEQIDASLVTIVRWFTRPRMVEMLHEWAGFEIERSGFTLLARIEELPEVHLAQLAAAARIDVSTASRQVARLVELGLVTRSPDPAEHRARRHRLTTKGQTILRQLRRSRHDWLSVMVATFSPEERHQFGELLARFTEELTGADNRDSAAEWCRTSPPRADTE